MDEFSLGYHLIKLRRGEKIDSRFHNHYLFKANQLVDILFTLPEYHQRKGQIFDDHRQPLILEIGCYMGDTLVQIAQKNPTTNLLGVDIKYKRVVKSSHKVIRKSLSNVKIIMADARELLQIMENNSIQGILGFFPDPWQKHKQQKHRFLNQHFFQVAIDKLHSGGFIWIKTDNKSYMEKIQKQTPPLGYYQSKESLDLFTNPNYKTFFEDLFIKENKPIHQMVLKKP